MIVDISIQIAVCIAEWLSWTDVAITQIEHFMVY